MKYLKLLAILTIVLFCKVNSVLASTVVNTQQKPNIIFIITDDQGMGDLGCTGNPYIKTPHIDQFSNDAVRFTNLHVGTTCAPTRGALMSGRHCNRVNVYHTIVGRSILLEDEVILPQVLAQNGYVNAMYGKWHLGDNYPYRPEDRGFHEVVRHAAGGIGQGPDYWMNDYFDDTYWHNGEHQKYEGYCTDVFFSEALKFIEKNKDKPFFCYLSTNAPHSPYNLPREYFDMYQGEKFEDLNQRVRRFYGMITNIDDNFKKLEDKLDELGLTENTILIFTTDNGTSAGRSTFNAGLRGGKGSQYDGGHRVPFFIRWPNGALTGGKDIDNLVANYDLLPTFVDLLGLDFNPVKPLDGKSLKPLLYNADSNWENRILYIDTQRKQNLVKYKSYSVMDDDWRLVDGDELYNITHDRAQENNVIDEHPEVAARLAEGYEKWWQSFMDDKADQKYAYIKVGSPYENPSKISAHDLIVGKYSPAWHQRGAIQGVQSGGCWKIEFVEDGEYSISLRRFPRESGLAINATFPAQEERTELDRTLPASEKSDFTEAYLFVADVSESLKIEEGQEEVTFKANIPAGMYDMEAQLIDEANRVHPAYYVYIEKKQPNIVIIYADDMGYGDLNIQNPDSKIPTPNLDQLASEGMRFTDAHSSSGVCTPSRYALLTGRYHWRQGEGIVGSWGGTYFDKGRLTLPAMLREKGYRTACIGKWHLGWDWGAIRNVEVEYVNHPDAHDWSRPVPGGPLDHGFDYYFGDGTPNFPPYTWIENDRILEPPTVPFTPIPAPTNALDGAGRGEGHDTRPGPMVDGWRLDEVMPRLTGKTVEWIGQQSGDQPFFLYWSWTAPHTPVVPIEEYQGSTGAGAYGDFMHQIDAHLGQVLQALKDNGFADNTLVIFTSDNGPESIAYPRIQNHDHYSMGSLRGLKQDVWEGGHRVPFIVRWPEVVEANTVSHELVSQIDVMGTIASLVGYALPDNAAEDSHDLLPLLRGESDQSGRETLVYRTWKEPWGIRHGDWVYIDKSTGSVQKEPEWRGYPPNPHEDWLNNIREDPGQEENLVSEYPERAESLRTKLKAIRESSSTAPRLSNDQASEIPFPISQ